MIKRFDRVALIQDFTYINVTLAEGAVGTCRDFLENDTIALIQYDYINDQQKFIGIPISLLRKANQEDLNNITDYRKLVPKVFHKNIKYAINNNGNFILGSIIDINLSDNELSDKFTIKCEDDTEIIRTRQFLEDFGSMITDNYLKEFEEKTVKTEINISNNIERNKPIENNQPIENIEEEIELDDIKININDYEFLINNNNLLISDVINLDKLSEYIDSLNKLKLLLKL